MGIFASLFRDPEYGKGRGPRTRRRPTFACSRYFSLRSEHLSPALQRSAPKQKKQPHLHSGRALGGTNAKRFAPLLSPSRTHSSLLVFPISIAGASCGRLEGRTASRKASLLSR